ncbi:MAG: glycosyltransferase family 39 protein [Actinobacteria bacterium]|nr:glycosyltransferase family 39 protein [Actinomycetota bacterium]
MRVGVLIKRTAEFVRRHPVPIAFTAIIALYLLTRLTALHGLPIFFDESIYIRWSQEALKSGDLLISLTDGKPPLHTWLMIPFVWIIKDPLLAGRTASVFFGAVTITGIVLIGKESAGWNTGLWAGFLYVLCPFTLWYDRVAVAEGLLTAIFTFTIWLAIRAAKTLSFRYVLPVGASIGLAMLTKGTALLLFLIVPFAFLFGQRKGGGSSQRRALGKWVLIAGASLLVGYAVYSFLGFSGNFHLIAVRTGVTTRTVSEILSDPVGPFFTNFSEILKTLIIFVTPLVVAAAAAGLVIGFIRRYKHVYFLSAWLLIVWIVESLVAKHWMFDRILPRFFLVIVPPVLILASIMLCDLLDWIKTLKTRTGTGGVLLVSVTAVLVLVSFPVYSSALIIFNPSHAPLPETVRYQYITGWPSGWGMEEIAGFLDEESRNGKLVVGSRLAGIGLPTDGLKLYLSENENVEIVPFATDAEELPAELLRPGDGPDLYCVYNMLSENDYPPPGWPLKLIKKFPKNGNDTMYMLLYEVERGAGY